MKTTSTTEENNQEKVVLFDDVEEFLKYYDALAKENEVHYIQGLNGGVNSYDYEIAVFSDKYDYQTKNAIEFAKWCDKKLAEGKKLIIGKNPDGTYWADIVK